MLHDPGMASVEVRGTDATGFLQAQLTSDVTALVPGEVALSAWCTPRGRVRNLFWIVRHPDGMRFFLIAPDCEADDLSRRLRGFVLRSKVEVERTGDRVAGAAGPGSEAFVSGLVGQVPAPGFAAESGGRIAIRPPRGPGRFLVLGTDPLPAGTKGAEWRRLEIAAGIAWLTDETRESFIPQMLNLDRLGALSFDKGCFPGQEVIARARYLGRVKRRLYPGRVPAGERPAPGDPVRSGNRDAGTIVATERDDADSGYALLVVVAVEFAAGGRIECEDGRRVMLVSGKQAVVRGGRRTS